MNDQHPSRRNKINLFNLDWTPLAHLMTLAGVRRLEFNLHKHRAQLAVLEYDDITDDEAPLHEGMQGAFVVFEEPDRD